MTKFRALYSALACGALSLLTGNSVIAEQSSYTLLDGSSQSNVDNACVGALPGATGEDCTYNQSNSFGNAGNLPGWTTFAWIGPVRGSNYYREGDSPFSKDPNGKPQAPFPDPDSVELGVSGTITIDDINDTTCDGDDVISARFTIEGGTRSFSGGPGTWAEETWGDDTIVYELPPNNNPGNDPQVFAAPDFQNTLPDGSCEYIFGSKGFPELLQTQGLGPLGVAQYPVDLNIGSDPINPDTPDFEQDAWDTASNPGGIGVGTFEGPNFDGNVGIEVQIDPDALAAGTYSCVNNFGDVNNPPVGDNCAGADVPPAAGTPCDTAGSNFCGARAVQENWIVRMVVDPTGVSIAGQIFANNESIVFNLPPAPGANNSWDGPLITFSSETAKVAQNDSYQFVTGTANPLVLDVGANDDPSGILAGDTTLTVNPLPANGTATVLNNDGPVEDIALSYDQTDNSVAFTDTFGYELDDGVTPPEEGLVAIVTVIVDENLAPVAVPYDILDLDTLGVSPTELSDVQEILDLPGASGGNEPSVTVDDTGTRGRVVVNGTRVTYEPGPDFFQGMDSFTYTITDDNFESPDSETTDPVTVTIEMPNAVGLPTIEDVQGLMTLEGGASYDFSTVVELGNGSATEHTGSGRCANGNGTIVLNDITEDMNGIFWANFTFRAPNFFDGDVTCTYQVTDENGNGESATGIIGFIIEYTFNFPGSGNALSPWTLLLLLLMPLARPRAARRDRNANSGDHS